MKTVLGMHQQCLVEVVEKNYYVEIFNKLVKDLETATGLKPLDLQTVDNIAEFWNEFWIRLPDERAIQRDPFWLICDICEFVFGGDE